MSTSEAPVAGGGSEPPVPARGVQSPWWARRPGLMLLPLRLFLGVTFTYAGLQKIANPAFFDSASTASIHAQLIGARHTSPIGGLVGGLAHVAPAVGWAIALGEVAIGLGTLVGLWSRIAAVAGMVLSFGLFLTVSFHSSPYFTGADIVFFFAWTPLALAGAAGAPSVDTWAARQAERPARPKRVVGSGPAPVPLPLSRRAVVARGTAAAVVAGAALVGSGLVAWVGRSLGGSSAGRAGAGAGDPVTAPPGTAPRTTSPTTTGATASPPTTVPPGHRLVQASRIPAGGSLAFTDPATGDPGLVLHQATGRFVAFDAICPHAGCTVAYAPSAKIIACPCHGSEFNPETGAVVRGPAERGLRRIALALGGNGELYVDG